MFPRLQVTLGKSLPCAHEDRESDVMSKSRELTVDEYLSNILKWRDQHRQSSLPSDQKLSERSYGVTVERYMRSVCMPSHAHLGLETSAALFRLSAIELRQ